MFYFAWVEASETAFDIAHHRMDENVFGFGVDHSEGGFATLSVDIRNPRTGLLAPGRRQWAWLSFADGATVTPLFFGRLTGAPADMQSETVTLTFVARPAGFAALKDAYAATLKVSPWWDEVWIDPARRNDPDTVLESRPVLWHVDRVSHEVSVSDIITGEDGATTFTGADVIAGSLSMSYGEPPLRRVSVEAEVHWVQQAAGTVDITDHITDAFRMAGTTDRNAISSFTGEGLYNSWPNPGDDIGGGWTFGTMDITRADGTALPALSQSVRVSHVRAPTTDEDATTSQPVTIYFKLMKFIIGAQAVYDAGRQRSERLTFTMSADVQDVFAGADDEESEILSLSSNAVAEEIDFDGSASIMPIRDIKSASYFTTDRGQESLEYLLAVARTRLLARARMVTVEAAIPFRSAIALTCRKSVRIVHSLLPGGEVTGKVIGYGFICDGDSGALEGFVRIGCCAGSGTTLIASVGTPDYVDDGYVDNGYQTRTGEETLSIDETVLYSRPTGLPVDDGVNFFDMRAVDLVESCTVSGGYTSQRTVLAGSHVDVQTAIDALNEAHTEVTLQMVPVDGGPFLTEYAIDVSGLAVPRTINLEAA